MDGIAEVSNAAYLEIERRSNDFQSAWQSGQTPSIEAYLDGFSGTGVAREQLFRRLLSAELRIRRRAGEEPRASSYLERFPAYRRVVRDAMADDAVTGSWQHGEVRTAGQTKRADSGDSEESISIVEGQDDGMPEAVGKYRLTRKIGEGGFGVVYLAWHPQLHKEVAIKCPRSDRRFSPKEEEQFVLEARRIAGLKHRGIVAVYDFDTAEGRPFIVQEYVQGRDLRQTLKQQSLDAQRAAVLLGEVAEAVAHAHESGLYHRDLKPSNILLDEEGRAVVTDFGLAMQADARSCYRGERCGTPRYMAPEQVRGESHRLDGRCDIWSLGVIFYEMLTGLPPFSGPTLEQLYDEILYAEPRPPRQIRPQLPVELERICLRCLSKRMNDRYATARDLTADLRGWLATCGSPVSAAAAPASCVSVIPKGLRCYAEQDADFYLELLPGPRDRDGLPLGVRDWKTRIEETDPDRTFSVGVLYGPSGSGKSSFVRAGLLPRLTPRLLTIYVEASAEDIEVAIRRELDKHLPGIPAEGTLPEIFAGLRNGSWTTRKVLIVVDQFEQWLHRVGQYGKSPFLQALRQCDGGRVQAMVLVRDDFWMGVTHFLRELEASRSYAAAVDRFSLRHARNVLAKFGQAYGVLPANLAEMTEAQSTFLDQAIQALAEDDAVACVQLSIFADMLKDKPWVPTTLKQAGGSSGVGETFLYAAFSSPHAPPKQRLHAASAQKVLEQLLPEPGLDIKGHTRSGEELKRAAGLVGREAEFAELVAILDTDLHLITPTDPSSQAGKEEGSSSDRFQLTHDYLIPSLRNWIQQQQRETWTGRAEIRLAERAALWSSHSERKQLPSLWEWFFIRVFTAKRHWSTRQGQMMKAAGLHHLLRLSVVAALAACVSAGVWMVESRRYQQQQARRVEDLVQQLWTVDIQHLGNVAEELRSGPDQWQPVVQEVVADPQRSLDIQTRGHLALAREDLRSAQFLQNRLLVSEREEYAAIADALGQLEFQSTPTFWRILHNDQSRPAEVIRAAAYLAKHDAQNPAWEKVADTVLAGMLTEDPLELRTWVTRLFPVRRQFLQPLLTAFKDPSLSSGERQLVASIVAGYSHQDSNLISPTRLGELALLADRGQLEILFKRLLQTDRRALVGQMADQLRPALAGQTVQDREAEILSRANAAEILLRIGFTEKVWPLLRESEDPRLRTMLIDRLHRADFDWADVLRSAEDPSIRQALVLAWDHELEELSAAELEHLKELLLELYASDPDPGVHAAVEWLLKRAGYQQQAETKRDEELAGNSISGHRWFVNSRGHTMSITPTPIRLSSRSLDHVEQHDPVDQERKATVDHWFAIGAHEVTVEQYLEFDEQFEFDRGISPELQCPINHITWYDAVKYCRWLSEQEGIPEDEMCYPPIDQIGPSMQLPRDYFRKKGYRLPTVLEWEHAVRGLSRTSRFYGETPELLDRYAWFSVNSDERTRPVGMRVPNALGLFDVYGNLREWCHPPSSPDEMQEVRGGSYRDTPGFLVSVRSGPMAKEQKFSTNGFRIAKTVE